MGDRTRKESALCGCNKTEEGTLPLHGKREEDEVDQKNPPVEQPNFENDPPFDIEDGNVSSPAPVTPLTPAEIASLQSRTT